MRVEQSQFEQFTPTQQKLWIIFFNKVKGKGEKMTFTKFSIKKKLEGIDFKKTSLNL